MVTAPVKLLGTGISRGWPFGGGNETVRRPKGPVIPIIGNSIMYSICVNVGFAV